MKNDELERLKTIEKRIKEIVENFGLLTTDIVFEIVPVQRMLEGMAYEFPINFSHWSFGRDYEKHRTIYDHTGQGIPYEQVWNFDAPRALLVETNPFALNVTTIAHVYGHVDYFLGNAYLKRGRIFSDVANETKRAVSRFHEYESKYGKEGVEKTIDAGLSLRWQQNPDLFVEEEFDDEAVREKIITLERERLRSRDSYFVFNDKESEENIKAIEDKLKYLNKKTPPNPIYDLLGYITHHSSILKPWQRDVLTVVRNQALALAPNRRTKMLDEGWATYWHVKIMRRLFEEGLLTAEEHNIFNTFHSRVTQESKMSFNWYRIGLALFENIKERWDRGRFGLEYEDCKDSAKRAYWDVGTNKGSEKIFQVRSSYSDRMAIEEFFTDEFIREMSLYLYEEQISGADIIYRITENRPEVIRNILKQSFALYGIQPIAIEDANYKERQDFYLKHCYYGLELEPRYRDGTLRNIHYLWGRNVYLATVTDDKDVLVNFDGSSIKTEYVSKAI